MPCSIEIPPNRDCIVMTIRGTITAAAALQNNREAHLLGLEQGISRYLVDLRGCRNVDSVSHNLSFVQDYMPTHAIDKHARVALLVDPDDHSHDYIEAACLRAGRTRRFPVRRPILRRKAS